MRGRVFNICVIMLAAAMAACDKPPPAPQAATTLPAKAQATSAAPATRPASLININGVATVFPPARMRLEHDGEHLVALLFSDDPREALKNNYTGNSFYLRMQLDIGDAAELAQTEWRFQAPSRPVRSRSCFTRT